MRKMKKKKNKPSKCNKSQVSFFIIFGILILIIFVFLYSYVSSLSNIGFLKKSSINVYVEECLYLTTLRGITLLGMQGGYLYPSPYYNFSNITIDIAFNNSVNSLVTQEEFKLGLKNFIDNYFNDCIKDFDYFKDKGYFFDYSELNSSIIFTNNNLVVDLDFPITYHMGESNKRFTIKYFKTTIPINIPKILDVSNGIIESNKEKIGYINMTHLSELDLDVYVITENNAYIFVVEDKNAMVFFRPYRFFFVYLF
jgi:hypothetical protein